MDQLSDNGFISSQDSFIVRMEEELILIISLRTICPVVFELDLRRRDGISPTSTIASVS